MSLYSTDYTQPLQPWISCCPCVCLLMHVSLRLFLTSGRGCGLLALLVTCWDTGWGTAGMDKGVLPQLMQIETYAHVVTLQSAAHTVHTAARIFNDYATCGSDTPCHAYFFVGGCYSHLQILMEILFWAAQLLYSTECKHCSRACLPSGKGHINFSRVANS